MKGENAMKQKLCSICEKKLGFLKYDIKDGIICLDCFTKINTVAKNNGIKKVEFESLTASELSFCLKSPDEAAKVFAVGKDRFSQEENSKKIAEYNKTHCPVCGAVNNQFNAATVDGFKLCFGCEEHIVSIDEEIFNVPVISLSGKKRDYIKAHDSQFFKDKLGDLVAIYPTYSDKGSKAVKQQSDQLMPQIIFNFRTQNMYIASPRTLVKFSDIEKYEVLEKTHEVTKKITRKQTETETFVDGTIFKIYYTDISKGTMIKEITCPLEKTDEYINIFKRLGLKSEMNNKDINGSSDFDMLVQLKNLLDMGVLTPEEFDKKKQQILGI